MKERSEGVVVVGLVGAVDLAVCLTGVVGDAVAVGVCFSFASKRTLLVLSLRLTTRCLGEHGAELRRLLAQRCGDTVVSDASADD